MEDHLNLQVVGRALTQVGSRTLITSRFGSDSQTMPWTRRMEQRNNDDDDDDDDDDKNNNKYNNNNNAEYDRGRQNVMSFSCT